MTVRIDAFLAAFDGRVNGALPQNWPAGSMVHSSAVSSHLSRAGLLALNGLPPDVALHSLVEHANEAISQFSDGVSEDAREPYGGVVTIDGGVLRVRFGRLPRDQPDAGWLAAEREPIPLEEITESA